MHRVYRAFRVGTFALLAGVVTTSVASAQGTGCSALPSHSQLQSALSAVVAVVGSGLNLHMWATVVDRDGVVCAVAFSGSDRGAQWPGSRVISAQKANTANAFSLNGLALSTANLYSAVQPGGSLFGLQESNPVNTTVAYGGAGQNYGQANDPMVGGKIGGVNVFGGGLALYSATRSVIGGVGVSGDTSCSDHDIAWRVRAALGLDNLLGVGGVSGDANRPDNIVYDVRGGPAEGASATPNASIRAIPARCPLSAETRR